MICKESLENPCIDHDHSTDFVRGLLCNNCNSAIGLLKEDMNIINNAIKYLRYWNDYQKSQLPGMPKKES